MSAPTSIPAPPHGLPAPLEHVLDQVRRRHLAVRLAAFPLVLAAALSTAWVLQALADRLFHLPWSARCVLLALDALGAAWIFHRRCLRPWRRRIDRHGAALCIERAHPAFRTALVSAVELRAGEPAPQTRLLVDHLVGEVGKRVAATDVVAATIATRPLKQLALRALGPVLAALILAALFQPMSGLLLRRLLLSNQPFPPQTRVIAISGDLELTAGGEVDLTARAEGELPADGRLVLTHADGSVETLPVLASGGGAEFRQTLRDVRAPFSYRFELNDGAGPTHHVAVRFPPEIRDLRFIEIPPAYTRLEPIPHTTSPLKLAESSTLRVEGTASTALRGGEVRIAGLDAPVALALDDNGAFAAEIPVPDSGWKSLTVHLVARDGLESENDTPYPVELRPDRTPVAKILQPAEDPLTVIPNETVPLAIEVRDDFGIRYANLRYRIVRLQPDGGSDTLGEGQVPLGIPDGPREWSGGLAWNLALLMPQVGPGSSIVYWIEASDFRSWEEGTSRSPERTIRVISESEKRLELLEKIAAKAAALRELQQRQRDLQQRIATP